MPNVPHAPPARPDRLVDDGDTLGWGHDAWLIAVPGHTPPSRFIRLGERVGAANAGRKAMTLVFAMVLGAACIDDRNVLRSRRLSALLDRRSERRRADAVGDGP
jgi:hypothetical protein